MPAEGPDTTSSDPHELRALLVRVLMEESPGQGRLEQLLAALEHSAKAARDDSSNWQSELAALKTGLATLRQGMERSTPLAELLARSDAQLAVLLAAAEKRAQAQLAQLGTQVNTLTERVKQLEAQVRKLAAAARL